MTTLEITAPTNKTLTTKLFQRGSDVLVETISLTEKSNCKTIYTGTVSANNLSGFYKAITFENTDPILTNDVYFDGSNYVYASSIVTSPSIEEMYDKLIFTVPERPVIPIPAPSSANTTMAYTYCYDSHGNPVSDIPVTIKLIEVSSTANLKGSYLSDSFTFYSDANGVARAEILRGTNFKYRVKSGQNGAWIEFKGVDAEIYQLPFMISR